jgi:hypothetical protein
MARASNYAMQIDSGGDTYGQELSPSDVMSAMDIISSEYRALLSDIMKNSQLSLDALEAELEAEINLAEAEQYAFEARQMEAELLAQEGLMAEEEGDTIVNELFFGDSGYTMDTIPPVFQSVVQKGLFEEPTWNALYSMLSSIGVEGLVDVMQKIRQQYPAATSEEVLMMLKYDKRYNEPYMKRFEGNRQRIAAGLAPLDDATYLANEAAYNKIFTSYGLNQFSDRTKYANFIGNNISPDEVAERVQLVYNRVQNAQSEIGNALARFYPELTNADLMAYVLEPKTQLPAIQRKIQAAEIGGMALAQGLGTNLGATTFTGAGAAPYTNVTRGTIGVDAMLASGATKKEAAEVSQYIAGVLPTAEKLSSIYGDTLQQYGQLQAEQEGYQGSAAARARREALTAREVAEFSGRAGVLKSQRRAVGGQI